MIFTKSVDDKQSDFQEQNSKAEGQLAERVGIYLRLELKRV